jgi:mycothiol synthase
VNDRDAGARDALTAAGYHVERVWWNMEISATEPLVPVTLPHGMYFMPFTPADAPALYAAHEDALVDHYGYTPTDYETWAKDWLEGSLYDPEVWLLLMADNEIAGFALCIATMAGADDLGWVTLLGVRPRWRKQGLGMALLQESFYNLQQLGKTRIALQVDSENTTHGPRLYQKAGMSITRQLDSYRRILSLP